MKKKTKCKNERKKNYFNLTPNRQNNKQLYVYSCVFYICIY